MSALALVLGAPALAHAQDADLESTQDQAGVIPAGEENEFDVIIVTGSNIRGAAPVGSAALAVTSDDVSVGGVTGTAQILQQIPQVFKVGLSEGSRGQGGTGNASYISGINLRGLSPNATLTLYDGFRMPLMGTGGVGTDPSVIPTIMLQRIDIVPDGTSGVYGSDAVAGVVNLILKKDVNGVEVNGRYGFADDYHEYTAAALGGTTWEGGQVTVAYEHSYHTDLNGSDRDFYGCDQVSRGGQNYCSPAPGTLTADGVQYTIPTGGLTADNVDDVVLGAQQWDAYGDLTLLPSVKRDSFAFTVDQDVGSSFKLFANGFYSEREVEFLYETQSGTVNITDASPFFIPIGDETSQSLVVSLDNVPRNINRSTGKAYNVVYGTEISLPADFRLTLSGSFGESHDVVLYNNQWSGRADPFIAAGLWNPYDPNAEVPRTVYNRTFDVDSTFKLQVYEAKLDGTLLTLPGGDVGFAVGYQHQDQSLYREQFTTTPAVPETYDRVPTKDSRNVDSVYGELRLPIFGYDNAVPGIQELTFVGALRYDKYSDINADTTNPKLGLNYSPVDGVTLRASYGTSFRAPRFTEISGNTSVIYTRLVSDPTQGGARVKGLTLTGPYPELQPEEATTYSFGLDLTPPSIPGLRFSTNYFNIEYTGLIESQLGNAGILNQEGEFVDAGILVRNPSPEFIAGLECIQPDGSTTCPIRNLGGGTTTDGAVVFWDGRNRNLGYAKTSGMDFQLNYAFDAGSSEIRAGVNGTYFFNYDVGVSPTSEAQDFLNVIFRPLRFRARGSLGWSKDGWNANTFVNYVNSYVNDAAPGGNQQVSSYTTVDANLGYTFENEDSFLSGLSFGLAVTNLFDQDPPYVNAAVEPPPAAYGGGFDPTNANPIGRIISVSVGKKF